MCDEKISHDFDTIQSASCPVEDPPGDKLMIQTTWSTAPSSEISPTVFASATPSNAEKDLEKQDDTANERFPWLRKALRMMERCWRSDGIHLNEHSLNLASTVSASQRNEFKPVNRPRLEEIPQGYPRLAYLQASDEAFSIYRGFNYLHARVIIDLQYELSELEKRLMKVDKSDCLTLEGQSRLMSRDNDDYYAEEEDANACERKTIMAQLQEKLLRYDDVLLRAKKMAAIQKANSRDYNSIVSWFDNRMPLIEDEWYSFQQQEDMVTLRRGREWAMFDAWVEIALRRCEPFVPFIGRIFRPDRFREQSGDSYVRYYHSGRVEKLVAIIITAIIFVLLIIPVVLMYQLTSLGRRNSTFDAIGVMVVFTLVFSAAMSLLTKAKRHELFGASAAYCAVLVVFISNFGGQSAINA